MKHDASLALIKFLSDLSKQLGVSRHVYVVGGAVRNFVLDPTGGKYPVKDIDVVIDSVALDGKDSEWFAAQVARAIPVKTNITTNQYGVALLHISGDWMLGDQNLKGEDIEIANARTESYADGGYTPDQVNKSTIHEDVVRREFTFNTLLWRLHDLAEGPDKAAILDLTGCGLRDLQEGVMRCPVSPDKTFTDDPSRMIRAIKFLIKYGFTISLEVERSIMKNKDKLKNIPHAHLSNMLINTFLREPTGKRAIIEMHKLGLLDVIKEIARTEKPFREALANWADSEAQVEFLFDLMDFGLPAGKRLNFLTPAQQQQVRSHTVDMGHAKAEQYLQVLTQPGKVLDTKALMLEFNLTGPAVKQIQDVARSVLVLSPELVASPANLMARVRMGLAPGVRVGKVLTQQPGESFGGGALYLADVNQDEFIHFTLASRAQQIVADGKLLMRPPHKKFGIDAVSAVSIHWGKLVPGVQSTHIKATPDDPMVAIRFKTSTMPSYGYVEEVIWDRDVILKSPKVISAAAGVALVRGAKPLGGQDQVVYRVARSKLANPAIPAEYHERLLRLRVMVTDHKERYLGNTPGLWASWFFFYKAGKEWAAYVIDHLALPAKSAKSVEMAVRLFSKTYGRGKGPPDIVRWYEDNGDRLYLLDAARDWPERSEESGIFQLGPFAVHDTTQASPKDLANAKAIIEKAVKATSNVPGLHQMAYGQLFLVGQLARKNWAAWYMPAKDVIYLRPGVQGSSPEESARHLVHELGHRLWAKKLDNTIKQKWNSYHLQMTISKPDRRLPEVGEVLVVVINNKKVKVESYDERGQAVLVEATTGAPVGIVDRMKLRDWVQEGDHRGKFPSLYAATESQEHFCEALSLYAMGGLSGPNLDAFEEIVLGLPPKATARLASRYASVVKGFKRTACIIAVGEFDAKRCLLKNRDRNYNPQIEIVHELIDGTEVAYFHDMGTDWSEGLNEHGVGVVNSALMVLRDEGENHRVLTKGKPTKDGERIREALSKKTVRDATDVICTHLNGLKGHTLVADADSTKVVESSKKYDPIVTPLRKGVTHVRTNHGILHPDVGYTRDMPIPYVSTHARRDEAESALRGVDKPGDMAPALVWGRLKDRESPYNMVRDTDDMFTSSQMVLNLTDLEMHVYIIPGKAIFKGVTNKLPEDYKPKIKVSVYRYGDMKKDEPKAKPVKLAQSMSLASLLALKFLAREAAKYQDKKEVPKADGKGTTTVYEYSEKQVQNRNREKAERVEKLRGNLHKLQAQVTKDLKSKDMHTRLCALAVGLMNDTYERVGNDESAKDGHVGVTGWTPDHIKFGDGKATITYVGKSGVDHEKVTKDAELIRVMKEAVKDKKKGDTIFAHEDGRVDATAVNEYLDGLGLEITAKDIRGLHANREMQERLKAVRSKGGKLPTDKKEREKKLKDEFTEALEGAAEAVGHESATLKSQYLVPGLEDAYLKDGTIMTKLDEKKAALEDILIRRVAARYLATKTPAQKEDKDVRQMLKSDPKKKPAREDLRRNRMRTDDADMAGEGEKDLSLNFKKVAERVARRWVRSLLAANKGQGKNGDTQKGMGIPKPPAPPTPPKSPGASAPKAEPEHKPGDVWQSEDKNWVAKNPEGKPHTFGPEKADKEKAVAYSKGQEAEGGGGEGKAGPGPAGHADMMLKNLGIDGKMVGSVVTMDQFQSPKGMQRPDDSRMSYAEANEALVHLENAGVLQMNARGDYVITDKVKDYKGQAAKPEAPAKEAPAKEAPANPDYSKALGSMAKALTGGTPKKIDQAKKDLIEAHPELEDGLNEQMALYDAANKELAKAFIRADGLKGKAKTEATKEVDAAAAKLDAAVGAIKALGKKAPAKPESAKPEPAKPESPAAPAPEAPAPEPAAEAPGGGEGTEEPAPPKTEVPKPPKVTPALAKHRKEVDKALTAALESLPKKQAQALQEKLGQDEATAPAKEAAEKGVKEAQKALAVAEKEIAPEVDELTAAIEARKDVDPESAKPLVAKLDALRKPLTPLKATVNKAEAALKTIEEAQEAAKAEFVNAVADEMEAAKATIVSGLAGKPVTAQMMAEASKDPLKGVDWGNPASVATALAQKSVTKDILLNPSNLGGKPLSATPLEGAALTERAKAAFTQFKHGNAAMRKGVAETAAAQLAELEPDSPQAKELNRIMDGLHLAMEMNGEKWEQTGPDGKTLLREPLDEKMGLLARQMVQQGDVGILLADSSDHHAVRESVRDAMGKLGDGELQAMAKDTPWEPLAGLLGGVDGVSLDPAVQELLRGLIRDLGTNNMTTNQGLVNAIAGKKMPASNPLDVFADVGKKFKGENLKKGLDALLQRIKGKGSKTPKTPTPDDSDDLEGAPDYTEELEAIKRMQVQDMADALERATKEMGVEVDPQNPHVAAVRHAAKTGDLSILDEPLQKAEPPHKPGEVWKNADGAWVSTNPDGVAHTFSEGTAGKVDAEAFAKGKITKEDAEAAKSQAQSVSKKATQRFLR